MSKTLIFCYGTLKSGKSRNFYLTQNGGKFLGKAMTTPNYRLVQQWLSDFPSLIEDDKKGTAVPGEIWSIPDDYLGSLDYIEGVHKSLFKRIDITLSDGRTVQAYVSVKRPYPFSNVKGEW